MDKNSIYQIIGYQGEYTEQVKKAIRKLLKENHPDNNGNSKIFAIINEVKEKQENNKVTYNYKKNNKDVIINKDIDYNYCYKRQNELIVKQNKMTSKLDSKNDTLRKLEDEYSVLYRKSIDYETNILFKSANIKKINNIKKTSIVLLLILVILFLLSIIKNSIVFLGLFTILSIICIVIISNYFSVIHQASEESKHRLKNYVRLINNIRDNLKKQENIKKEINEIKKTINNCKNDLRFYNNILK